QPHVVPGQPRIRTHRPPIRGSDLPVAQHLIEHEPREPVLLPVPREPHPLPIIDRNVDRRPSSQLPRSILDQLRRYDSHLHSEAVARREGRRRGRVGPGDPFLPRTTEADNFPDWELLIARSKQQPVVVRGPARPRRRPSLRATAYPAFRPAAACTPRSRRAPATTPR